MHGPLTLSPPQRRVIGVLIEKALTTPDSYPLTLHAIVLGCNQKQNRDPVVEYEEGHIGRVVHELMQMELVRLAPVSAAARSNRFQHLTEERLNWARPQQAIMAELLLRGPQTIGELRTRAGRMTSFPDLASVSHILDELAARQPPHVRAMPREPGKSAVRHTHLLSPDDESETAAVPDSGAAGAAPADEDAAVLTERIARLETLVGDLQRQLAELHPGGGGAARTDG